MRRARMLCSVTVMCSALVLTSGAQKGRMQPGEAQVNPQNQEQAKVPVRQLFEEMFSQGRYEVQGQVFAANCPVHFGNRSLGLQEAVAEGKGLRSAAPDLVMSINQMSVNGNMVTVSWTARGTHTHPGAGFKPTNRRFTMQGRSQFKVVNGKIVEAFNEEYRPELFRQLGVSKGQAFMFYAGEEALSILSPAIPDRLWNLL
ncbi:MAG TPA: ester cyclase [Terriglobales bacterium]